MPTFAPEFVCSWIPIFRSFYVPSFRIFLAQSSALKIVVSYQRRPQLLVVGVAISFQTSGICEWSIAHIQNQIQTTTKYILHTPPEFAVFALAIFNFGGYFVWVYWILSGVYPHFRMVKPCRKHIFSGMRWVAQVNFSELLWDVRENLENPPKIWWTKGKVVSCRFSLTPTHWSRPSEPDMEYVETWGMLSFLFWRLFLASNKNVFLFVFFLPLLFPNSFFFPLYSFLFQSTPQE